jgi:hypothetical protein
MAERIQTFKLVSAVQSLWSRDFEVNDPNYVVPGHTDAIIMGEFVEINDAYKLIPGDGAGPQFAVWAEEGRSDVQAIRQLPILFLGGYEADTLIFNTAAAPALGAKLEVVNTLSYNSRTVSGLQTHAGGAKEVVGFVTRRAANNNDYLRFLQVLV